MDKINCNNFLSRTKNKLVDLITEEADDETKDKFASNINIIRRIKVVFLLYYILLIALLVLYMYATCD